MNTYNPVCPAQKATRLKSQSSDVRADFLSRVRSKPVSTRMIIAAIIALAAILRLFMLSSQSLWWDEGASLAMTDSGNFSGTLSALWSISGGDKYQAVYFLILSQWRSFAGDSQFLLQSLSVIPGILTPFLVYLLVKDLFSTRHALCAALFVTASAYCISFSQEVRPYAFLLCVASLHLLAMTPALKETTVSNFHRWRFAFVTLLATLSSIFLTIFIIALAITHLLTFRDAKRWFRWWSPSVLLSIPALLYYASTPARTSLTADAINSTDTPLWENMVYALYSHLAGQTYGPAVNSLRDAESVSELLLQHATSLGILAIIALALTWCVIQVLRKPVDQSAQTIRVRFFVALFIVSYSIATAFAYLTSINWMPRHSFYLMVPLSVLVSIAVVHSFQGFNSNKNSRISLVPLTIFPALIVVNLYSSYQYFFKSEHLLDDYRSTATYLSETVSEQDASLMLWGEPYLLSYYGHPSARGLWRLEDPAVIMSEIDEAAMSNENVYITINRESTWARYSDSLHGLLDQTYTLEPTAQFTNFTIYRLEKGGTELAKVVQ